MKTEVVIKKASKQSRVNEMLKVMPDLKAESIVTELGVSKTYACTMLSKARSKFAKKKRGRPSKQVKALTDLAELQKKVNALTKENIELHQRIGRLVPLEHALHEKDKEMWTLECDLFDKKAIIKYLEAKLGGQ